MACMKMCMYVCIGWSKYNFATVKVYHTYPKSHSECWTKMNFQIAWKKVRCSKCAMLRELGCWHRVWVWVHWILNAVCILSECKTYRQNIFVWCYLFIVAFIFVFFFLAFSSILARLHFHFCWSSFFCLQKRRGTHREKRMHTHTYMHARKIPHRPLIKSLCAHSSFHHATTNYIRLLAHTFMVIIGMIQCPSQNHRVTGWPPGALPCSYNTRQIWVPFFVCIIDLYWIVVSFIRCVPFNELCSFKRQGIPNWLRLPCQMIIAKLSLHD